MHHMSTRFGLTDWRSMSQDERDRGLNNGLAVAGSGETVAGWDQQPAELRSRYPARLALRAARRERKWTAILKAADRGPTLVFIHGGYWQARAKESFTLFAGGAMAHGIQVAVVGYTRA